ncbi:MAG: hypothetical protein AAGU14_11125 [Eubacteriaceae bacterium]
MGNIIEFKKHMQQTNDSLSGIYSKNKLLKPVHAFDCPVPLYTDEDGQLYTAFYYSDTGKTIVIPFFDDAESFAAYEKKKGQCNINMATSELR